MSYPKELAGKDTVLILADSATDPSTLATATTGMTFLAVTGGKWDGDNPGDETTNSKGLGFFSEIGTTKKWSGNITCVNESSVVTPIEEGQYWSACVVQPLGKMRYGVIRIQKMNEEYIDPKGACKYNFDFTSIGPYTVANSPTSFVRPAGA